MSVRKKASDAGDLAFSAVRMPVTRAAQAVGVAIGTTKAVSGALNRLQHDLRHRDEDDQAQPSREGPQGGAASGSAEPEEELLVRPPQEPPVDVVEQALAAEAAEQQSGAGRSTEPSASSRDEEHGDASLQRAELEEWADEIVEGRTQDSPAGDVDVATPVGTTGADVGYNPDTAEADLQQPETEPLMDPSLTKSVKAESETLSKAADPEKG